MLQEVYRPVVGEVAATVIINGCIVGTWTSKKTKKTLQVSVKPLKRLAEKNLKNLKPVAEELANFIGVKEAQVT